MINVKVSPTFGRVGKAFSDIKLGAAIQDGIKRFAGDILSESQALTPVDTGLLRGSERVDLPRPLEAIIAPHVHYAVYVHEGTRKMRARPFMEQGLEISKRKKNPIIESISKYIDTEVRKI